MCTVLIVNMWWFWPINGWMCNVRNHTVSATDKITPGLRGGFDYPIRCKSIWRSRVVRQPCLACFHVLGRKAKLREETRNRKTERWATLSLISLYISRGLLNKISWQAFQTLIFLCVTILNMNVCFKYVRIWWMTYTDKIDRVLNFWYNQNTQRFSV